MTGFQTEKKLVLDYYDAIAKSDAHTILGTLSRFTADDWHWRGFHPFNEQSGAQAVAKSFWQPWLDAVTAPTRRQDIFFAGYDEINDQGAVWVVSMGHLVGLFDNPFLGIPPTGKIAFLRYAEFNRIENGKITETALYCDIPHFMVQAGLRRFAHERGQSLVQPGPETHDGLLFDDAPPDAGAITRGVLNKMINILGRWNSGLALVDELALSWHDDMIWWGPTGVGATYTIPRYADQHSCPFRAAFAERTPTKHLARIAEGNYAGFFGCPNFTARHVGEWCGQPASDNITEFRVIDIYRRDGDKLAENWIFIDILHWFSQLGINLLQQTINGEKHDQQNS